MRRHGGRAPRFRQCAIKIGHRLVGVTLKHIEHRDGGDKPVIIAATDRRVEEEVARFFKASEGIQIGDTTLDVRVARLPIVGFDAVLDKHRIGGKKSR